MSTASTTLQLRMKNPAIIITETLPPVQVLGAAVQQGGQRAGVPACRPRRSGWSTSGPARSAAAACASLAPLSRPDRRTR